MSLTGCYVKLYGNQSTSGGTSTTVTSSQVSGSAKFSGGRVGFSSGPRIPRGAPGGHLKLSGDAAAVLIVGVVIADFLNAIRGEAAPKPLPPDTRIADTCSCYKKPAMGDE
ncbi:MAG: hypothetical protein A3I02_16835 [Betaproteobacteria bacterium RIFCSPLOWO2_02_FULL_67_26]|nr:MAG: hypothetical protein A3I02_16835 [Betaproteobacteria bacterium RIFCSPLOWO2_02_FULL_67_26]